MFKTGTQESLMLADRFSWKLCVYPIINRWRHMCLIMFTSQPGLFFRMFTSPQQSLLVTGLAD